MFYVGSKHSRDVSQINIVECYHNIIRSRNYGKCIGKDVMVGKIGSHCGFSNGKAAAISMYEATEKRNILSI